MPIDITVPPAAGRQIVERYGGGGFIISGVRWTGSVLILPNRTLGWPVSEAGAIEPAALEPVLAAEPRPRILVVGCGRGFAPPTEGLEAAMREGGIGVEWMNTGAACRTYNVLVLEDRDVAAALIAID